MTPLFFPDWWMARYKMKGMSIINLTCKCKFNGQYGALKKMWLVIHIVYFIFIEGVSCFIEDKKTHNITVSYNINNNSWIVACSNDTYHPIKKQWKVNCSITTSYLMHDTYTFQYYYYILIVIKKWSSRFTAVQFCKSLV